MASIVESGYEKLGCGGRTYTVEPTWVSELAGNRIYEIGRAVELEVPKDGGVPLSQAATPQ
jgi:hypothetical protein